MDDAFLKPNGEIQIGLTDPTQNKLLNAVIKPRRRASVASEDGQIDTATNTTTTASSSSYEGEDDSIISDVAPSSKVRYRSLLKVPLVSSMYFF